MATEIACSAVKYVDAETNLNLLEIRCNVCESKILKQNTAVIKSKSFSLPHMKAKDKDGKSLNNQVEDLNQFWFVDNMMTFENVGFSRNVGTIKYLICADCELGPIGYHDTSSPNEFYVAHARVAYK